MLLLPEGCATWCAQYSIVGVWGVVVGVGKVVVWGGMRGVQPKLWEGKPTQPTTVQQTGPVVGGENAAQNLCVQWGRYGKGRVGRGTVCVREGPRR